MRRSERLSRTSCDLSCSFHAQCSGQASGSGGGGGGGVVETASWGTSSFIATRPQCRRTRRRGYSGRPMNHRLRGTAPGKALSERDKGASSRSRNGRNGPRRGGQRPGCRLPRVPLGRHCVVGWRRGGDGVGVARGAVAHCYGSLCSSRYLQNHLMDLTSIDVLYRSVINNTSSNVHTVYVAQISVAIMQNN